jgi:hypothetical protein
MGEVEGWQQSSDVVRRAVRQRVHRAALPDHSNDSSKYGTCATDYCTCTQPYKHWRQINEVIIVSYTSDSADYKARASPQRGSYADPIARAARSALELDGCHFARRDSAFLCGDGVNPCRCARCDVDGSDGYFFAVS